MCVCTPFQVGGGGGYPIQSWIGGCVCVCVCLPPSRPGMGYSLIWTQDGVTPPSRPEMVYTPIWTWDRILPNLDRRWGTPHPDLGWGTTCRDKGWDTPLIQTWDWGGGAPIWTWDLVHPPRPEKGWGTPPLASVNRLKILPSLILQMRAVTIYETRVKSSQTKILRQQQPKRNSIHLITIPLFFLTLKISFVGGKFFVKNIFSKSRVFPVWKNGLLNSLFSRCPSNPVIFHY